MRQRMKGGATVTIVAVVVALVLVAVLAAMAYRAGRASGDAVCEQRCPRVGEPAALKRSLEAALALVLARNLEEVAQPFVIPPDGEFRRWAAQFLRPLLHVNAVGEFNYLAAWQYGFDLADSTAWGVALVEDGVEFRAPPLALIGCPAINTGTLRAKMFSTAVWVDEDAGVKQVQLQLTTHVLRHAENRLRDDAERAKIRATIEPMVRKLVVALAAPYRPALQEAQVRIVYPSGEHALRPWPAATDTVEVQARLQKAGCLPR